jgi:hypothetical protein
MVLKAMVHERDCLLGPAFLSICQTNTHARGQHTEGKLKFCKSADSMRGTNQVWWWRLDGALVNTRWHAPQHGTMHSSASSKSTTARTDNWPHSPSLFLSLLCVSYFMASRFKSRSDSVPGHLRAASGEQLVMQSDFVVQLRSTHPAKLSDYSGLEQVSHCVIAYNDSL